MFVLESLTLMHDAQSSMNNPTAHTYNTTVGTTKQYYPMCHAVDATVSAMQ